MPATKKQNRIGWSSKKNLAKFARPFGEAVKKNKSGPKQVEALEQIIRAETGDQLDGYKSDPQNVVLRGYESVRVGLAKNLCKMNNLPVPSKTQLTLEDFVEKVQNAIREHLPNTVLKPEATGGDGPVNPLGIEL